MKEQHVSVNYGKLFKTFRYHLSRNFSEDHNIWT